MDKRASDMIDKPVITLDGGDTIAHVKDMIVDPTRRQVLALVTQEKMLGRPARAIPFGRIAANGVDAVLVPNVKVSLELDRDPVLRDLDNVQRVQGADVMTDSGRKVGKVADMMIDDHTGEIKSYELAATPGVSGTGSRSIPADGVVNLGKDVLYITEAAASALGTMATEEIDVKNAADEPLTPATKDLNRAVSEAAVLPSALAADLPDLSNMLGGTNLNTRLLLGIIILVLGILVLVYPSLLPLIAGISLIVLGLWIALQGASTGTRP